MQNDMIRTKGEIEATITHLDGRIEKRAMKNTVLLLGRNALANSLAGQYGGSYQYNITHMLFGSQGTDGSDIPKYVDASRIALYDTSAGSRATSGAIDPLRPNEVIFSVALTWDDLGTTTGVINEMGLQMANGSLYSMATFPIVTKTTTMQITWSWRISFF
jgi:hypothetical protein